MIAAVVLAAGASSRMGSPKALLPLGRRTFLESILDTLRASGVRPVRVVLGADAAAIRAAVAIPDGDAVVNPAPERGMLSSVRCGLRALPAGTEGTALWPVDHPLVTVRTVLELVARFELHGGSRIVVPVFGGRRGHPVVFPAATYPELLAAPDELGARAVVHRDPARRDDLSTRDPGVVADIDTPEAFARATAGIAP